MGFSAPVLAAVSAASSAVSTIRQVQSAAQYSMASNVPSYDRERAELSAQQQAKDLRRLVGRERARTINNGVSLEGSPSLILDDLVQEGELNQLITRQTGEERALRSDYLDRLQRNRSKNNLFGSSLRAGTSLLTGSENYGGY